VWRSRASYENLLIRDAARRQSLWYWVKREGPRTFPRDHLYVQGQPGDLFLSKLAGMVVDITDLDRDGQLPVTDVAHRLKRALDVERVTKRFFTEFQQQHLAFIEHIDGVPDEHDRRWYASVLLNRLMFVYFLQKKGFLDGGRRHYLREALDETRRLGPNRYFEEFLKPLFFEGFARPPAERSLALRSWATSATSTAAFLPHRVR
jgi:hypothetical protein